MGLFSTLALAIASVMAVPYSAAAADTPNTTKSAASAPAAMRAALTLEQAPVSEGESDQTLHAMHDEMDRARTRLQLPGVEKPFYLEYRLVDLDVRTITSTFGALVSSSTTRNRFMSVDVRVEIIIWTARISSAKTAFRDFWFHRRSGH